MTRYSAIAIVQPRRRIVQKRDRPEHYHRERNHQGLSNRLILPIVAQTRGGERIVSRERIGGLLKYYHRPAAQDRQQSPVHSSRSCVSRTRGSNTAEARSYTFRALA